MISVQQHTRGAVEEDLARLLRCAHQIPAISTAIVAEHIRASLFGALVLGSAQTIHTTRLLSNARRALMLTWPASPQIREKLDAPQYSGELCRDVLDRMEQLGDVWDCGNGQWIATPLRYVTLEGSDSYLILGSAPSSFAEERLKATISCAGASRFASVSDSDDRSLAQPVDTWLGVASPLDSWTTEVVDATAARMQNVGGLSAEQLEIYAPDIRHHRPGRWIAAGEVSHELPEVRLCRPTTRYAYHYNRPYYLARFAFKHSLLTIQSQALVPYGLTLRLRFGLDLRLRRPRQMAIVVSDDSFTIERPLRLPDPECRVLALGWPDRITDSVPERLTFHKAALPIVLHALRRLSVHTVLERRFRI